MDKTGHKVEEVVIPLELKTYLTDIADGKFGYKLGDPWKFDENVLGVVVPVLRTNAPDRQYITMYEVLDQLGMKDTGHIDQVELQNKTGMAIFVRAGTIFTGKTQNRAVQHSGVYTKVNNKVSVRCVHASHMIESDAEMKFGDIAPPSVTSDLMGGDQGKVWGSVRRYTSTHSSESDFESEQLMCLHEDDALVTRGFRKIGASSPSYGSSFSANRLASRQTGTDNLLDHLKNIKNQSIIDDMMQQVPLFPDQVGAIIFNPVGVIAFETFDHPRSWESIKKEIIEKYGDKIKDTQAEHLFELKKDAIIPALRKFIESLSEFTERTIMKDNYSETREVRGKGVIGEYTLVKGQPIHVLLLKETT